MRIQVVYLKFPTSNRNSDSILWILVGLYILNFLHQIATVESSVLTILSCIS